MAIQSERDLKINWKPSAIKGIEEGWSKLSEPGAMTYEDVRFTAASLLERDFVCETLAARGSIVGKPTTLDLRYIQGGLKNAIFLITALDEQAQDHFVLVLSKGSPGLNEQTEADFKNLGSLRDRLLTNGLPTFVPRAYVLGNANGLNGFSVEYLPRHVEMNSNPSTGLRRLGFPYTEFFMNSPEQTAMQYNLKIHQDFIDMTEIFQFNNNTVLIRAEDVRKQRYYQVNQRIKTEVIARLFVVYKLTGAVPVEFSINAGDMMADPTKDDFDLRLITTRGGLVFVSEEEFPEWLYNYDDEVMIERELVIFPVFDRNQALIQQGIQRGEQILSQR